MRLHQLRQRQQRPELGQRCVVLGRHLTCLLVCVSFIQTLLNNSILHAEATPAQTISIQTTPTTPLPGSIPQPAIAAPLHRSGGKVGSPAPQRIGVNRVEGTAPLGPIKYYAISVKVVAVDEAGQQVVLGEPVLQTTRGTAGVAVDHPDGRRFEVNIRLVEPAVDREAVVPAIPNPNPAAPVPLNAGPDSLNGTVDGVAANSVEARLSSKVSLDATDQPRKSVIDQLAKTAGIQIVLDPEVEQLAGVELGALMSLNVEQTPVQQVLDQLVVPLKLEYAVRQEMVVIASAAKLKPPASAYVIHNYLVSDLIELPAFRSTQQGQEFQLLIERIQREVAPESWGGVGGDGVIRTFGSTLSLVIRQTDMNHQRITTLLERLRSVELQTSANVPAVPMNVSLPALRPPAVIPATPAAGGTDELPPSPE